MRYYSYYPGCSLEATGLPQALAAEAICKALDIELAELDDWNCCGSAPYGGVNEIERAVLSSRNLSIGEKTGLDIVTPCPSCYITLNKANTHFKKDHHLRGVITESLAAANMEYRGTVKVRHFAEVLFNDITPEAISAKVKTSLSGLKVAPYYGCQLVRPGYGFDDPEDPTSLDILVESLGATAVPFPLKARCCGGSLIISEEGLALDLMNKLFSNAKDNGAQLMVSICPLCQTNLDAYQSKVSGKFKANYDMPVLFLGQLIGVALGLDPKALGLDKNIVSANKVLSPYI